MMNSRSITGLSTKEIRRKVKKAQRNYKENIETIENMLKSERGYVSKVPKNEPVVVLMSGGLDSSVMIDKIIEDWNVKVYPLFFRRGARAERPEEQAFDSFVNFYKRRFPENFKETKKLKYEIPPSELKENFPKALALTVGHPLRNSTMQNLAVMYAVSLNGKSGLNIKTIFFGSVAEDNTEPEQGLLSLRAQTLNACIQTADWGWQITSPLTDPFLTENPVYKADLIEYAMQKFIPLEKTRTCFSPYRTADGTCFACQKRLKAFDYLKMKDPAKYKIKQGKEEQR